ncbi:hypothetical protein LCGC14_1961150, partial [marine sediment metagenome]|nr:hypothetical protein [Pricia sp.]
MANPNWTKGVSGNPKGRPKKPLSEKFEAAVRKVEKIKGKPLFEHFVEQAYEDNNVLVAVMKKRIS